MKLQFMYLLKLEKLRIDETEQTNTKRWERIEEIFSKIQICHNSSGVLNEI